MRARGFLLAVTVCACLTPATAWADWLATPFIGFKFGGSTTFVDLAQGADNTKLTLGGSLTFLDQGFLGIEAEFGYTPRFFDPGPEGDLTASGAVTTLTGNVMVLTPPGWTRGGLRPFAVGGAGWMHVGISDVVGAFPVDSNVWTMTLGGGAIGSVTDRTSLRFELRYFKNLTGDPNAFAFGGAGLSFWRIGVGVAIKL
jgi:opacity protein-like surface antigen